MRLNLKIEIVKIFTFELCFDSDKTQKNKEASSEENSIIDTTAATPE